jgi:hypothetical protein
MDIQNTRREIAREMEFKKVQKADGTDLLDGGPISSSVLRGNSIIFIEESRPRPVVRLLSFIYYYLIHGENQLYFWSDS